MKKVIHTEQARLDLFSIWDYIAEDNPNAADKLLDAIDEKCVLLGENPQLGQACPDIAPDMRYFPVRNYLILYREQPPGVELVRVLHGARDLDELSVCE
jgi:toxin ParE1/3/4